MNKDELIKDVADRADTTQKQTNAVFNALIRAITDAVARGEKVTIVGFGTFEKRDRKACEGRNPKTGEALRIPAAVVPVFTPGKTFKEAVNND